ncbi:MAG TPA: ABC transporter ATP-binding protein [Phycisphaerae bacterium]|nr:ABC transporter ATP-binding protein [Phycisphaerae bacterium]
MIELHNVTKVYQMGLVQVRALDGVSMRVEPGEFVAITGASGSGKSTMMHIIGALDRPTAGTYRFQSQPVDRLTDRQLATLRNRSVGFVFQTFNLINASTALHNVGLPLFYAGRGRTTEPAMRALEAVGLVPRATHRPTEMSGGERQRVAIARAIVNNPAVVLADEPTGNLDSKTGQQIMDIFHQLNAEGVTIILVTHEPDIAAQAKRVILMRDGKIVGDRSTDSREGPVHPASPARLAPQTMAPYLETDAVLPKARAAARAALLTLISLLVLGLVPLAARDLPTTRAARMALAIASLLAVGGFIGGSALAIRFGRGARRELASTDTSLVGRGRATAAMIVGIAAMLIALAVMALFVVSLLHTR